MSANTFGRSMSEGGAQLLARSATKRWDRHLDAEDSRMQAIRGFAMDRTASSHSAAGGHKDPFARAASMPVPQGNPWSLDNHARDAAPPKEQMLRVLEELSSGNEKPSAQGMGYLEWACKECGLEGEFQKKKNDFLFTIGEFDDEEEFSLDDMKADLLNIDCR
eukprot:2197758-Rhodomonas_salina.1